MNTSTLIKYTQRHAVPLIHLKTETFTAFCSFGKSTIFSYKNAPKSACGTSWLYLNPGLNKQRHRFQAKTNNICKSRLHALIKFMPNVAFLDQCSSYFFLFNENYGM